MEKDETAKKLLVFEKRYESVERNTEAAKAKLKETEHCLGASVSVHLCFSTVFCLESTCCSTALQSITLLTNMCIIMKSKYFFSHHYCFILLRKNVYF